VSFITAKQKTSRPSSRLQENFQLQAPAGPPPVDPIYAPGKRKQKVLRRRQTTIGFLVPGKYESPLLSVF